MKENILYIIFSVIYVICIVFAIIAWIALIIVGILDLYEKNPNTLFITIPFVIYIHVFGYLTFTRK
jgi:hypothetical protein